MRYFGLLVVWMLACDTAPVEPVDSGRAADAASARPDAAPSDAGAAPRDAGVDARAVDAGRDASTPAARIITVCLTGAVDQTSGSNSDFTDLCDALDKQGAGVVRSGAYSSFATFPGTTTNSIVGPTLAALDRNGDSLANVLDGPTQLNLIGFSWGGMNIESLASNLAGDSRIDHSWLNMRMIALDGFQPGALAVNSNSAVDAAYSFRHSIAPAGDCSNGAPLGPYLGKRLACAAGRTCGDYDFSLAPARNFGGLLGNKIGHCDVPLAARAYVLEMVFKGAFTTALPPSVPVTP